jgi:hypothetical protein
MTLLNTANKIYQGSQLASRVYLGTNKVWPSSALITAGLAGGWKLSDQSSGTTVNDWSGNTATFIGSPTWVAGGLSLNGSDQGLLLADSTSLQITGPITITARVRTTGTSNLQIIQGYENGGSYAGWGCLIGYPGSGQFGYYSGAGGGWQQCPTIVNDGAWRHIACVESGGTVWFYLDGAAAGSATGTSDPNFYSGTRAIGITDDAAFNPFAGTLADIRVYNRALSAAEIAQIYAGTG